LGSEADAGEVARALAAIWRVEAPRVIAAATRVLRDLDRAEEVAQDTFVAALEQWPRDGVPANPGAWLVTTVQRRAVDAVRRAGLGDWKLADLAATLRGGGGTPGVGAADDAADDDVLRLMFLCCHPVLPFEARTALTLRLLAGLSTREIARAYLLPEATIAQRLVRAKRTLVEHGAAFEALDAAARAARLGAVLEVLYLAFNEGHSATAGERWTRPELCDEATRLARALVARVGDDPEVLGLAALLELQGSRLAARCAVDGAPILLADQDRARWDRLSIQRGLALLSRAQRLGGTPGNFGLQAEIAACHARAASPAATDWRRIVALYGELLVVAPSPVVELNRAVAVGMAFGPAPALVLVDHLRAGGALAGYHHLCSARGELLARLGRRAEAAAAFAEAARLARNEAERESLLRRARELETSREP